MALQAFHRKRMKDLFHQPGDIEHYRTMLFRLFDSPAYLRNSGRTDTFDTELYQDWLVRWRREPGCKELFSQ
jgi:hypothetical protein